MSDTTNACPECDSHRVRPYGSSYESGFKSGWYCTQCDAEFDRPIHRESHNPDSVITGDAKALLDANPEEFPK